MRQPIRWCGVFWVRHRWNVAKKRRSQRGQSQKRTLYYSQKTSSRLTAKLCCETKICLAPFSHVMFWTVYLATLIQFSVWYFPISHGLIVHKFSTGTAGSIFRLICDGLFYVVSEFSGPNVIDPFNPSEASVRSFKRIVKKEGVADSYANNCLLLLHLLCVLKYPESGLRRIGHWFSTSVRILFVEGRRG